MLRAVHINRDPHLLWHCQDEAMRGSFGLPFSSLSKAGFEFGSGSGSGSGFGMVCRGLAWLDSEASGMTMTMSDIVRYDSRTRVLLSL